MGRSLYLEPMPKSRCHFVERKVRIIALIADIGSSFESNLTNLASNLCKTASYDMARCLEAVKSGTNLSCCFPLLLCIFTIFTICSKDAI